jgi:hypothetical protein
MFNLSEKTTVHQPSPPAAIEAFFQPHARRAISKCEKLDFTFFEHCTLKD